MAKRVVKKPTTRRGNQRVSVAFGDILDYELQALLELEAFAQNLMEDLVFFGEDRMKQIIEAAITPTGEARAGAGGNGPGRVDSSKMLDAVLSSVEDTGEKSFRGQWGWLGTVLEYFLYQEYGNDSEKTFNVKFEGMKALQQSYIEARELMKQRLQDAGLELK